MSDTRFTTVADDLDDLIGIVDVDDVGDIETLLVVLFGRAIGVRAVEDDVDSAAALEVIVWDDDLGVGTQFPFPLSVLDLTRQFAATVAELVPITDDDVDASEGSPDILAMDEPELITTLHLALGQVRIYNMLYPEDEDQG